MTQIATSIHAPDFTVISANAKMKSFLGVKDLKGYKCYDLFHKRHYPISTCPMQLCILTKKKEEVVIYYSESEGYIQVSVEPILGVDGKLIKVIHTIQSLDNLTG
jgi:hypothetical protein